MSLNDIIALLSNFGLPALVCGASMWYVYYREGVNDKKIEKMQESYADTIAGLQVSLENNTNAVTELVTWLKAKES